MLSALTPAHGSPWPATLGLLAAAGSLLPPGGVLSIYGPFMLAGQFTTDSNRAFHERLVVRWVWRWACCLAARVTTLCSLQRCHAAQIARADSRHVQSLSTYSWCRPTSAPPTAHGLPAVCSRLNPLKPSLHCASTPLPSNPEWGYRDTDAIAAAAAPHGLVLAALEEMPANNFTLVFKKQGSAAA